RNGKKTLAFKPENSRFYEHNNHGPGAKNNASRKHLNDQDAENYSLNNLLKQWQLLLPKKLFLLGDSTLANKQTQRYPETGWGMALDELANTSLHIENHAVNGRSSKSFYDEGRWGKIMDQLQAGDYVFIQFGHNDQKIKDPTRYSQADTEYANNLIRYINQTRSKGAIPLLATSICRRSFNENNQLQTTHGDYPEVVRSVAKKMNVALFDLQSSSFEDLKKVGEEKSISWYLHTKPGQYTYYKEGKTDNTHLSPNGARWIAQTWIKQLQQQQHPLMFYF
ncbi:MAG: rhamnogalacturonan acetylesterase, partial [Spongiibacteraceae bacterium]|nr:rhamnogalacturonan acetylesterase [Spongiibacteraceae bacterium]